MFITSHFNPKGLRLQLVLFLLAPLALFAPAFGSRKDIIITIAVIGVMIAIAACIALFLVVKKVLPQSDNTITDDFDSVELAFNNLSTEDQDYLLEVYQEELILDNDLNNLNDLNNEESI